MKPAKAFYLDENYKYPTCHTCGKELSPFCVTSAELNEYNNETLEMLIEAELLRINAIEQDKHVIFICKICCPITKEKI